MTMSTLLYLLVDLEFAVFLLANLPLRNDAPSNGCN